MNFVWNHDGVRVGSISMNRWDGPVLWTSGFCWKENRVYQWEATATPQGYLVVLTGTTGRIGEWQGPTFNLPLEIAAAVRRLS